MSAEEVVIWCVVALAFGMGTWNIVRIIRISRESYERKDRRRAN